CRPRGRPLGSPWRGLPSAAGGALWRWPPGGGRERGGRCFLPRDRARPSRAWRLRPGSCLSMRLPRRAVMLPAMRRRTILGVLILGALGVNVRATPQVQGGAVVHQQGDMSSLACSIALLVASGLRRIGPPHPMEVTVQDDALFLHQSPAAVLRTAHRLAALGADRIRLTAGWSVLAPSPNARRRPARFDPANPAAY